MNNIYLVYYKTLSKDFRICYSDKLICTTVKFLPKNISSFYLTKPYKGIDDELIRYCHDIKIASDELQTIKQLNYYSYIDPYVKSNGEFHYKTHMYNIETIFKFKAEGEWNESEPIDIIEDKWYKSCYNGGLQYCKPGEYDCYGYDFSNFYASLLGDSYLKIPTKKGKEHCLTTIDKLQSGFYRIKITCDDSNITKVFSFSKNHCYHYLSVKYAYELKNNHNFNINFELIIDDEPNAYLYDINDLTKATKIFSKWYKCILSLKKQFPKNILIKMLSSSLWGHLSKRNSMHIAEDKLDTLDGSVSLEGTLSAPSKVMLNEVPRTLLSVSLTDDTDYKIIDCIIQEDGTSFYKLLNVKKPYKYNIRLKPFITAYGRNKIATMALPHIDNIIRIHTDGVTFDREISFNPIYKFIPEKKTTGHIYFKNVNIYPRL